MRVRVKMPGRRAEDPGIYVWLSPTAPDEFPFRIRLTYMWSQEEDGETLNCVGLSLEQNVDSLRDLVGTDVDQRAALTPPVMRDVAARFRNLDAIARAHLGLSPGVEHVSGIRRRRELSDGFLQTIAERYREHVAHGASPVQALAREEGVSRRTAANWVAKARQAGYLAPPRTPTGEEDD